MFLIAEMLFYILLASVRNGRLFMGFSRFVLWILILGLNSYVYVKAVISRVHFDDINRPKT